MTSPAREPFDALLELHREIDEAASLVAKTHAARLRCGKGCSGCCLDDLTVRPIEAERIRRRHAELLRDAKPHPPGACAFLDEEGACRIYADRPSVCRSQGLPLRIVFEDEAGDLAEHRDICPLNLEGGPTLGALAEEDCWLVGPFELRLAAIDACFVGAPEREPSGETGEYEGEYEGQDEAESRVSLRGLFRTESPARPERSRPTTLR